MPRSVEIFLTYYVQVLGTLQLRRGKAPPGLTRNPLPTR